MDDKISYSIKVLRVISTFMIFLCHTVFLYGDRFSFLVQFFNVAVSVFLIISAYLYSLRDSIGKSIFVWYKKRIIRIVIPYYVFLAILFIFHLIIRVEFDLKAWISSLLCVQGYTERYVTGTGHLWFITAILLCYIVTPILYKIREKR